MHRLALITCALLLCAPALAKQRQIEPRDVARHISRALKKGDAKGFLAACAPGFTNAKGPAAAAKVFARTTTGGLTPLPQSEELRVVGLRSLLPVQLLYQGKPAGEIYFQIARPADTWWVVGVEDEVEVAEAWLKAGLKTAKHSTPDALVKAFVAALLKKDVEAARDCATERAWTRPGDTIYSIYRQAARGKFTLRQLRLETKPARAVSTLDVVSRGEVVDRVWFYLLKRGGGWLIGGSDEDKTRGARYLANETDAKPWPRSARELANSLASALESGSRHRARALCSAAAWKAKGEELLAAAAGGSRSAQAEQGSLVLQLLDGETVTRRVRLEASETRGGWRVSGWKPAK